MTSKKAPLAMRSRAVHRLALPAFALVALASLPASADAPPPAGAVPPGSAPGAPGVPGSPAPAAPPPASAPPYQTNPNTAYPSGASPVQVNPLMAGGAGTFGAPGAPAAGPGAPEGGGFLASEAAAQFRRKKQWILAGSIVFGLAYYGALAASSAGVSRGGANSREYIPGLIPIVGPFVTAGLRADPNGSSSFVNAPGSTPDYAGMSLYLALGVVQAVGAGVFVAGLRMPTGRPAPSCSEQLTAGRPCPPVRLSFAPVVTPTFAGGGLTGEF